MESPSEVGLLAYFLRVAPQDGEESCVVETGKETAAGMIRDWKSVPFAIQFAEPAADEVVERIGMRR